MDQEHEPFLPATDASREKCNTSTSRPSLLAKIADHRRSILVHTVLILLYTLTSMVLIRAAHDPNALRPPSAIDNLDFAYTRTVFHNLTDNPYAGPPSPALDAAWSALLAPMHIRVSAAELRRDNQDSIPLTRGGYLGWMGVFHGLHCVNMLREYIHKDHYHPDLNTDESAHLSSHADHCIEHLRQATLCHADASLTTFKWVREKRRPLFNASESVHACVDWGRLMGSVRGRVVGVGEVGALRNPLFVEDG